MTAPVFLVGREHRWVDVPVAPGSRSWAHPGVALLPDGRVVTTHPDGDALVVLDGSGPGVRVPVPLGEVHAIHPGRDGEGRPLLWLADNGHAYVPGEPAAPDYAERRWPGAVVAVDHEGVEQQRLQPPDPVDGQRWWSPCAALPDDRGDVWVADGYGHRRVHRFSPAGDLQLTLTGDDVPFTCPHGLALDGRGGGSALVVADRDAGRLLWFDLDGRHLRTVASPALRLPAALAVRGDLLVVADLAGALVLLGPDDEVVDLLPGRADPDEPDWPNVRGSGGLRAPDGVPGRFGSPHAVTVAPDGRMWVAEWVIGGRLTLLEPGSTER